MRWLHDNDGMDAGIDFVKMDLTYESIGGKLWVDIDAQEGRPHVLVVADTYGYSRIPLARAAVALHITDDMQFTLDDEQDAKDFSTLNISRGDPLRGDATLGDESVTIRISYGDDDRGDVDRDD